MYIDHYNPGSIDTSISFGKAADTAQHPLSSQQASNFRSEHTADSRLWHMMPGQLSELPTLHPWQELHPSGARLFAFTQGPQLIWGECLSLSLCIHFCKSCWFHLPSKSQVQPILMAASACVLS